MLARAKANTYSNYLTILSSSKKNPNIQVITWNFLNSENYVRINNYVGETYKDSIKTIYSKYEEKLENAKSIYKDLYKVNFEFYGYEDYLSELKKLPFDAFSKFHLYKDSIRLDIDYKTKLFFIEYFKDENVITVTSKTDNLRMKESKLGIIQKTMESFFV